MLVIQPDHYDFVWSGLEGNWKNVTPKYKIKRIFDYNYPMSVRFRTGDEN